MQTYIGSVVVKDKAELEVYECSCGFHIGVDATYLEQGEEGIVVPCPSCNTNFIIEPEEDTA